MKPFVTLGIALGLGLLIGLQRERADSRLGGIRTFPLICLFGAFCGMLAQPHGGWIIAAGIIAILATLSLGHWITTADQDKDNGNTTEVAALLTFAIGAYLPNGNVSLAALAAGLTVILLHLKEPMHAFVRKMGPKDMNGVMQFVVVSLIILPLLPNRTFGPFNAINPHEIWRMVALIVGLSLSGYIVYKIIGGTASALVGGLLGGLISSTATTVSYARRAKSAPSAHKLAVTVILIASAVAYYRVILEVSLIARSNTGAMLPPLTACAIWVSLVAAAAFFLMRGNAEDMPEPGNPAELKSALVFGLIYAVITFGSAAVQKYFGASALYAVAVISGLTDMDAITLSLSRMVETKQLDATSGWRLVLVASLSNFIFKGISAAFLAGWRFGMRLAPFFAAAVAGGVVIILLWPSQWTFQPK